MRPVTVTFLQIMNGNALKKRSALLVGIGIIAALVFFRLQTKNEGETAVPLPIPTRAQPADMPTVQMIETVSNTAVPPRPTVKPEPTSDRPSSINGIPISEFVSMDAAALQTAHTIFAHGQELGRDPHAFSKAGDSTIALPHFLARFDEEMYTLADFAYLQPTIEQYQGSFSRDSAAVRIGMHSWTMLDPAWADKSVCLPNETAVSCEIRLHNPSIMLIRLGANDNAGDAYFDEQMRLLVETIIEAGVLPVIGTKSDRAEGSDVNNSIIRQITADYHLPVWDFDRLADSLPAHGLDVDNTHMSTFYAHDYSDPTAFTRGHAMHNLTALILLDMIHQTIDN